MPLTAGPVPPLVDSDSADSRKSSSLAGGDVAGIIVGLIALVVVCAGLRYWRGQKKKAERRLQQHPQQQQQAQNVFVMQNPTFEKPQIYTEPDPTQPAVYDAAAVATGSVSAQQLYNSTGSSAAVYATPAGEGMVSTPVYATPTGAGMVSIYQQSSTTGELILYTIPVEQRDEHYVDDGFYAAPSNNDVYVDDGFYAAGGAGAAAETSGARVVYAMPIEDAHV